MLGHRPENTQEFVSKGVLSQSATTSSCIYYNKSGGGFGRAISSASMGLGH